MQSEIIISALFIIFFPSEASKQAAAAACLLFVQIAKIGTTREKNSSRSRQTVTRNRAEMAD